MGKEPIQLGAFEELVLMVTAILHGKAYGVKVMDELETQAGRRVNISAVHTALDRLEKKGYLSSYTGGATSERGGRSKRFFKVTSLGAQALEINHQVRSDLYQKIPKAVFEFVR